MTNENERIIKDITKIAKRIKKKGHDVFFMYHSHVESVTWELYIGGWKRNKDFTLSRDQINETKTSTLKELLKLTGI